MTISTNEIERLVAASKHYRKQLDRASDDIAAAVKTLEETRLAALAYADEMALGIAAFTDMGDQTAMAISDQQKLFPEADEVTLRIDEIAASISPNGKGKEAKP